MKRLAYLVAAAALTCLALLFSSDLIGRSEPPRLAAVNAQASAAPAAIAEAPAEAVRQVRIVLPAPFEPTR